MKKIAIVILNWNQSDYTISCLRSISQIDYENFSVFLIDNGSKNDELDKLSQYINKTTLDIRFSTSNHNLGFTGGNNLLLKEILKTNEYEYSLLLNNDTLVEKDFLTKLVKKLKENPEYGSVGPLVLNANDNRIVDSAGTKTIVSLAQGTLIGHGKKIDSIVIKEREVGYITGCALLIKNEVLREVGLLDDNFFAYFEDIDLGVRLSRAGYKNIFYPESIVYHYGSISTGLKSEFYYMLSCRNRILFAKKHNSSLSFYFVFTPYFILWKLLFKFITSRSKINFIKGHIKGIKSYLSQKDFSNVS